MFAALATVAFASLAFSASALAAQQYPFLGYRGEPLITAYPVVDGQTGDLLEAAAPNVGNESIDVFDSSNKLITTWTGADTPAGSFGQLTNLFLAADDATGRVYVRNNADNSIDVLSSSGSYICQITGAGSTTSTTVSATECDSATSGTPTGPFGSAETLAVDQATGNIYVSDSRNNVVDIFSSAGAYLGQLPTAANSIAVDDFSHEVLLLDPNGVDVYNATTNALVTTWTGSAVTNPPGTPAALAGNPGFGNWYQDEIAADDATGDVWVMDQNDAVVDELSSTGAYLGQITGIPGRQVTPQYVFMSVEQATGNVLVSDGFNVNTGASVESFSPNPVLVPDLTTGAASPVAATSATLSGTVNPDAVAVAACRFEVIDTSDYNQAAPNPYLAGQSVPCDQTPAQIGSGTGPVPVSADVTGLSPSTTYHYRLLASNANGSNYGSDQTLTTLPVPVIDATSTTAVTASSATLDAQVNPEGFDATCQFQYGTSTSYGTTVPCSPADLGTGTGDVPVSQPITGLTANTTYHWRLVAIGTNGTTSSGDQTFVYDTAGGGGLPDGRAYEMVTPVDKNGVLVLNSGGLVSADGNRLAGLSLGCYAGSSGCTVERGTSSGVPYLYTRTASGWTTTALDPAATLAPTVSYWGALPDAGLGVFSAPTPPAGEDDWWVTRANGSPFDVGPQGSPSLGPETDAVLGGFVQSTGDASVLAWLGRPHWSFDTTIPSTAPNTVYEYAGAGNSQPDLVGVSGGPGSTSLISQCATFLGGVSFHQGALSADGRTVVLTASGHDNTVVGCPSAATAPPVAELFARVDRSQTVAISEPVINDECTGACQSAAMEDAVYAGASADGSKVLFTSSQQETDDSTPGSGNLYMYDFGQPAGHNLIDVSAGDSSGLGPSVEGVMAISPDGSHVYFVAQGLLTSVANSQGQSARAGANNLYVYERDGAVPNGHLTFITSLSGTDVNRLFLGVASKVNVTSDGHFLVFLSTADLTADDTSSSGAAQVFEYDAQADRLIRVSVGRNGFNDNGNDGPAGATIATASQTGLLSDSYRSDPTMSDDGSRVFFSSPVGLTPQALNDAVAGAGLASNVYEWERAGVGSCPATQSSGCTYLISDGRDLTSVGQGGGSAVSLLGTDGQGANVFFTTGDQLVPEDTDTATDVYDARIGGGFPYTPAPPNCQTATSDSCQGTPASTPTAPTVATFTFSGPGDASSGARPVRVRVLSRVAHGSSFVIQVSTPAAGQVTISGASIKTMRRLVGTAGTYWLRIALTKAASEKMERRGELRVGVAVSYRPPGGPDSIVGALVSVKPAFRHTAPHAARRATSTTRRAGA